MSHINNDKKINTLCWLRLSERERTNGTSSVSEADTQTALKISKKTNIILYLDVSH